MIKKLSPGNVLPYQSLYFGSTPLNKYLAPFKKVHFFILFPAADGAPALLAVPFVGLETLLVKDVAAGEHHLILHLEFLETNGADGLILESVFSHQNYGVPLLGSEGHGWFGDKASSLCQGKRIYEFFQSLLPSLILYPLHHINLLRNNILIVQSI